MILTTIVYISTKYNRVKWYIHYTTISTAVSIGDSEGTIIPSPHL